MTRGAVTLDAGQRECFLNYRAGKNLGVFGSARCGKSVLLRAVIGHATTRYGPAAVGVCSWNGSAADLIGGVTLHSLFSCGIFLGTPESFLRAPLSRTRATEKLRRLRILIVDEVFTITSGALAVFLRALRGIRPVELQALPAGGLQVVCTCLHICIVCVVVAPRRMCPFLQWGACLGHILTSCASCSPISCFTELLTVAGDPLQTLPVELSPSPTGSLVFQCLQWRSLFRGGRGAIHALSGSHRCSGDTAFGAMLERMRLGFHNQEDIDTINKTWDQFSDEKRVRMPKLRALCDSVSKYNVQQLQQLVGSVSFSNAIDELMVSPEKKADVAARLSRVAPNQVCFKVGAPIIATRRLSPSVPTGTMGVVVRLSADGVECLFKNQRVLPVPVHWEVFDQAGRVEDRRLQLPIILAWAVTIHRAQGSEMECVCIDFSLDRAWACDGLVYAAVSRVRSFGSLCVRGLTLAHVRTNPSCLAFWMSMVE